MRLPCLVLVLASLGGTGACRSTGEVYETRSGNESPAGAACTDDAGEEDDTLEQALAAAPLSHVFNHGPLRLEGRVACPGDEDWIHAYSDCCNPSGARVRWDASRGPLEVELLDSEGNPLPLGAPGDIVQRQPGEVYLLRAEYGGRFLVRVRTSGEVAVPYSVELFAPVFVR
ncbi:hypothetical protein CYFUS_005554 [Cystobacter fuscus]|uniref:Lipoprotein n=1 Tax=Cystobacter fuscus TaxID=43 RepID=A0A250JA90_9BACT|nr:hypothetical protein [Cystobacter fuscus]ATB40106.1 hypothetical protein CYFUS_005554 [Cystobacter fuscus]